MIHETKYRKQAMQLWETARKENEDALQTDLKPLSPHLFAYKKKWIQRISSFLLAAKRHPYK